MGRHVVAAHIFINYTSVYIIYVYIGGAYVYVPHFHRNTSPRLAIYVLSSSSRCLYIISMFQFVCVSDTFFFFCFIWFVFLLLIRFVYFFYFFLLLVLLLSLCVAAFCSSNQHKSSFVYTIPASNRKKSGSLNSIATYGRSCKGANRTRGNTITYGWKQCILAACCMYRIFTQVGCVCCPL